MPRKRMIDPEFWSDEEIGKWSHEARLFYIGLWNFSDDVGRFKAHPQLLKSQIFPYDTKFNIEKLKKELNDKVQWYSVNDLQYGYLRNFNKHQRIDKPSDSKLPTPPPFQDGSANAPGTLPPNIREEKLSKDKIIYVDFEKSTLTLWNNLCDSFPVLSKTIKISESRRTKLKSRFTEGFKIEDIIEHIKKSKFLLGENQRKWKVSLDWLIENDKNYLKVIEGKYSDMDSEQDLRAKFGLGKE